MILECNCGKVYRIKEDPGNVPTRCPSCGKVLRIAADSAPAATAPDARVGELEARLQAIEKDRASERAELEEKTRALEEARQSIARLGDEHAKAHAAHLEALAKKDLEIHEYAIRCQDLQKRVDENPPMNVQEIPASDAPATPETAEATVSPDTPEVSALPETESVLEMGKMDQAGAPEQPEAHPTPPAPEKKGFFSKMFGKKD